MNPAELLHYFFDPDLLGRYGPRMLEGLAITGQLVMLSFTAGLALGLLLALARMHGGRWLSRLAAAYIGFFRGSPLLAQLFLLYYGIGSHREFWEGLGLWWFFGEAWYCALLVFTLNTAAYQAEIFRAGLLAVPTGQQEAAQALGLSRTTAFFKVVLPQSLVISLGPLGNELILMIKASAIASLVTLYDLMGVTRLAFSRSFDFSVYLWAALLYLLVVEVVRRVLRAVEHRLCRHLA